jgi:beta-glucosidase
MLTDTLRTSWGFEGWVVSDCGAISNIASAHKFVNSSAAAAALAISAGCDIECDSVFATLPASIASGAYGAREADVDTALFRMIRQQLSLGVFDDPARNPCVVSSTNIPQQSYRFWKTFLPMHL